jgi:hypothetical protein
MTGDLHLADLFADLEHPSEFLLDDPWLDGEADPPEYWYIRILTLEESAAITWR